MTIEDERLARDVMGWRRARRTAILGPGREIPWYWYDQAGRQGPPCVTDPIANLRAWSPTTCAADAVAVAAKQGRPMIWQEPRPVEDWLWLEIELWLSGSLLRVGRVSWTPPAQLYRVSINLQTPYGMTLPCWPDFRVLSDAQTFVERLMIMPLDALKREHGTEWPFVVKG